MAKKTLRSEPPPIARAKPRIQSVARSVSVLLEIARSGEGLRAVDIRERLKLPRQVTYHMVHTLLATGIIRKNEDNRYFLGLAAAAIADGFRRQLAPSEHLAPLVRSVAAATGETAYASGWLDGRIVTLASARGHLPVHAGELPLGYGEHAHARASGKLLLALADPAIVDDFLAENKLVARTPHTITSARRLRDDLALTRRRGYALDDEEFSQGLCCIAAPLAGLGHTFAIGIAVPTERFGGNFERYLRILKSNAVIIA
ncbi:MAG: IclR family transcriptional regulator [Parvibaculaceae bacterium]